MNPLACLARTVSLPLHEREPAFFDLDRDMKKQHLDAAFLYLWSRLFYLKSF